jgi:hypothetical protein
MKGDRDLAVEDDDDTVEGNGIDEDDAAASNALTVTGICA